MLLTGNKVVSSRRTPVPRTVHIAQVIKAKFSAHMILAACSKVIFPAARSQWGSSVKNPNHAMYILKSNSWTTWASVKRKLPKFYRAFKTNYRRLVKSDQDFKVYHTVQRKMNRLSEDAIMRKVYEEVHRRIRRSSAPRTTPRPTTPPPSPTVSNQKTTLAILPKVSISLLDAALLPAVNAAYGCRFDSGAEAIAFMQQRRYRNWSRTRRRFRNVFIRKMKAHLQKRFPKFKAVFDKVFRRYGGLRDIMQAKKMYGVLYSARVENAGVLKCSGRARPTPTPTPPSRPVISRPTPTPTPSPPLANRQLARQRVLINSVRAVYGASTSESAARSVLKTQKWNTLRQLGITSHIMKGFRRLGYVKAASSPHHARKLVQKTLRHWSESTGSTYQPTARPGPRPTPAPTPRPSTQPASRQLARQKMLVASVRAVYGASTSESAAKTVLKTQKWSTLRQLGITSHIMKGFRRLGDVKAASSARHAQRLVKNTLRNWRSRRR